MSYSQILTHYANNAILGTYLAAGESIMNEIPKDMWGSLADFPLSEPPPVSQAEDQIVCCLTLEQGRPFDLTHPTWHGHGLVIASSVALPIMLAVASTRIYAKCFVMKKWTSDDSKGDSNLMWTLWTDLLKIYSS
jgi:hypothetical protein